MQVLENLCARINNQSHNPPKVSSRLTLAMLAQSMATNTPGFIPNRYAFPRTLLAAPSPTHGFIPTVHVSIHYLPALKSERP